MEKRKEIRLLGATIGLICSLLAGQVAAHGIYATHRHDDMVIVYGHGPSDEKYENKDLLGLDGYDKEGKPVSIEHNSKNGYITFSPDENLAMISATFDNGYWSEQPDGEWVKKPKDQVEGAKQGGRYMKYNVSLLKPLNGKPKATGMPLEILPLVDPLTLKPGDKLEIQVLANGKPQPDTELVTEFITNRKKDVVKTDSDGKAEVTIRNEGLNVLATETEVKAEDITKADKTVNFATLAFTYPLGADE